MLMLSGDIEENAGPTTCFPSTESAADVWSALDEIRSNQASLRKEMKAIETTISQN